MLNKLENKHNAVVRGVAMKSAHPFDFGIKGFKKLLKENKSLTRAEKNKAVRLYKQRINERLIEIKETLDKEVNDKVVEAPFNNKRIDNDSK